MARPNFLVEFYAVKVIFVNTTSQTSQLKNLASQLNFIMRVT